MTKLEKGVYAASLTPLDSSLHCQEELLAEHCLQLLDRGCTGIVLFGTTGEGSSFSNQEKRQTLKQLIKRGLDPQKIILANGYASLQDTVDLALFAFAEGCLPSLVAPQKEVTEFYRELIRQVPRLQLILYHIPQNTGVPITAKIVETLFREFPETVVGYKESEGNLSLTEAILKAVPHCKLYVGNEMQIPAAMQLGASGTICGLANYWPELICSTYQHGTTLELEKVAALFRGRPFIPSLKALLAEKNPLWRNVRPPLLPEPQREDL